MDKTSTTLGWLVGRQIAGQRRTQEKQPIAYLYNGVQLPLLPEYDTLIYPYACIIESWLGPYTLLASSEPLVFYEDSEWYSANYTDAMITPSLGYDTVTGWQAIHISSGNISLSPDRFNWANYDICCNDTVIVTASDPIPVYE